MVLPVSVLTVVTLARATRAPVGSTMIPEMEPASCDAPAVGGGVTLCGEPPDSRAMATLSAASASISFLYSGVLTLSKAFIASSSCFRNWGESALAAFASVSAHCFLNSGLFSFSCASRNCRCASSICFLTCSLSSFVCASCNCRRASFICSLNSGLSSFVCASCNCRCASSICFLNSGLMATSNCFLNSGVFTFANAARASSNCFLYSGLILAARSRACRSASSVSGGS